MPRNGTSGVSSWFHLRAILQKNLIGRMVSASAFRVLVRWWTIVARETMRLRHRDRKSSACHKRTMAFGVRVTLLGFGVMPVGIQTCPPQMLLDDPIIPPRAGAPIPASIGRHHGTTRCAAPAPARLGYSAHDRRRTRYQPRT